MTHKPIHYGVAVCMIAGYVALSLWYLLSHQRSIGAALCTAAGAVSLVALLAIDMRREGARSPVRKRRDGDSDDME